MGNFLQDRSVISISGKDKETFLQGIITNDINLVTENNSIYCCMLTPQGKYFTDMFISKLDDKFLIDVPSSRLDSFVSKIDMYKLRSDVEIAKEDFIVQSLRKTDLESNKEGFTTDFKNGKAFVDPRSKSMKVRAIIPHEDSSPDTDYNSFRIGNIIPESDKDFTVDKSFPLEFGMNKLNAISFDKGCYVGQELTARTHHRGVIRKAIYKVESSDLLPEKDTIIRAGDNKIGVMCSSSSKMGLALIRVEDYEKNKNGVIKAGDVVIENFQMGVVK